MMLSVATQLPARRPSRSRWTPAGTPLHWHVLALLLCSAAVAAQAAGLSTGTCNSRLVQTSGQFATALATPDASVLQLAGTLTLLPTDYSTPIIMAGRNVTIEPEGSGSAALDFNDIVGAVLLVGESQLTLRNLQLRRLAPATAGYSSGSYVSTTSMLWPSINAAPGSKFHLDSTVTHFMNRHHGDCVAGTADRAAMLKKLAGGSTIEIVADGKMVIHQMSLRANVTSGNVVVGFVEYTAVNTTVICVEQSAVVPDADIGGGASKTWPIAPTVLGCLLFLVSGALAALFVIYRRRDMGDLQRRLLQRVLFLPFDGDAASQFAPGERLSSEYARGFSAQSSRKGEGTAGSSLVETPVSGRTGQLAGPRLGRQTPDRTPGSSPRAPSDFQAVGASLQRSSRNDLRTLSGTESYFMGDYNQHLLKMRLQGGLEGVELGPILGRGSYGRVYKGRWQSALVAIKVVEHSLKGEAAELEGARESLLAASISHPNVVACYKICTVKLNRTRQTDDDDDDAAVTLDSEEALVRSVMRSGSQDSLSQRPSLERLGSSAAPSWQASLASRAPLSRPDSSAGSSRQHSLRGDDMDQLLLRQASGKGPSPPRSRSLELRMPPSGQPGSLGEPSRAEPLMHAATAPGDSISPPAGARAERQETVAQLSQQLSPKWGAQLKAAGRQRSQASSQAGSGGGSIHKVSSIDGRDLTVEVIDRAPGMDSDGTRQTLRGAQASLQSHRASMERARVGASDSTLAAAVPPAITAEHVEAAGGVGGGPGNRSVDLARTLEGRAVDDARGMAAQQAGQSHPPTALSGRRSIPSARAHSSGGLETIPSGLTERTASDGLSIPEVARTSLPSTAEGEEPLTFSGRRGINDGHLGISLPSTSGETEETESAEPMELEIIGTDELAANANEQGELIETWMLLEYADRGSLEQAIGSGRFLKRVTRTLDMGFVYKSLQDIATGMQYLHGLGIIHGDLKAANVLLKSTNTDARGFICKLADFGLSRILDASATHISTQSFGTVPYMPPELLSQGRMTKAVDVYSFGMLMWQIWTGDAPFKGMQMGQVMFSVITAGVRPEVPQDMLPAYRALMESCWQTEADARPEFDAIMVALRGQAQRHTADMRESASAGGSAAMQPPVQSPFVGAAAREGKPEASRGRSQAAGELQAVDAASPLARVASPFATAAVPPPGAPGGGAAAEPAHSPPAAAVDRSASLETSLAAHSESSVSTKSGATVTGALAPLSSLARRLHSALSRSSIPSEAPSTRHASFLLSSRRASSGGGVERSPDGKLSASPGRDGDLLDWTTRDPPRPPRVASDPSLLPIRTQIQSPLRPGLQPPAVQGTERGVHESVPLDGVSLELLEVGQTDKVADPRIELRVRHRHTMRADAANTQARDAERFTRLVRKQEPGSGPLRYSIELRRSAGPRATVRRRSAGDRKRRPVELTVTHETVSDADAGVSTPPRRNSFQARRPPEYVATHDLGRPQGDEPADTDASSEQATSASISSSIAAVETAQGAAGASAKPSATVLGSFAIAGPHMNAEAPAP